MSAPEAISLTEVTAPSDAAGVAECLRAADASHTPVYPHGGRTSLEYGLAVKTPGIGLDVTKLARVVDYPARDMTITVESGVTLAALANTLAAEGQRLPIDAPHADRATIGGVIATNHSGPLRCGHGTMRDYVLGISAVDGCGRPFRGGGRVVKNVAGYDFCKLLVGSMGTLGVVTEVTLKVKPLAAASALMVCDVPTWTQAERLLAALVDSATTPVIVELASGPAWQGAAATRAAARLIVGVEGTAVEVDWMRGALLAEWRALDAVGDVFSDGDAILIRQQLTNFSSMPGPLVIKAAIRRSAIASFAQLVLEIDPRASIQAHAASGIVIVRFADFPAGSVSRQLIGRLRPAAVAAGGNLVVLSAEAAGDLTREAVWGHLDAPLDLMRRVKEQFDPRDILNRGRFVF